MTGEAKKEVEKLLLQGGKIAAIKHLRDTYNFSLQESKILVEALEEKLAETSSGTHEMKRDLDADLKSRVKSVLERQDKIEAIRIVKEELQVPLKEAKVLVEGLERGLVRPPMSSKREDRTPRVIFFVFVTIGSVFLLTSAVMFFSQGASIDKSELVTARVIRMETDNQQSGSAPVIEYEWDGKKWLYASKIYSTPPAYSVNEQVPVYVNSENPNEIIINTFLGRWFLIVLFGFLGVMFLGIPFLVYRVIKPPQ